MSKHEIVGICAPVSGYEEDYLSFFDSADPYVGVGACGIMRMAGAEPTRWDVVTAFGYLGTEHYPGTWQEHVEEYRKESGRQFPPLYRVKIQFEAEPLSDEECADHWKRRCEAYK